MSKIQKFQLIDTLLPAEGTATRIFINDQPQLRFVSLHNLVFYNNNHMTRSIVSNNILVDSSWSVNAYLVLYFDNRESINKMPLNVLLTNNNQSGQSLRNTFSGQQIIWSKSYFQLPNNNTTFEEDRSILLGVYYS
jgi:hypothetical protein